MFCSVCVVANVYIRITSVKITLFEKYSFLKLFPNQSTHAKHYQGHILSHIMSNSE
jgi:hypothetical protein